MRTTLLACCLATGMAAPAQAHSIIASAPVAPGPSSIAVNPATRTAYVASGNNTNGTGIGGHTISVIDTRGCNARTAERCAGPWPTIAVGDLPSAVAVDVATNTVFVANVGDATVSVIDGSRCNAQVRSGCGQTPATVPVGAEPLGMGVDPASHTVYVGNFDDGTVSMIDGTTCNGSQATGCTASSVVDVGGNPGDVDFDPRTHTAYVTNLTGLSVFDTRTCNARVRTGCDTIGQASVPPCDTDATPWCGPFFSDFDPAHNTIYESGGTTTVWVFDTRRCNASTLMQCAGTTPAAVTPFPQPGYEASMSVAVDTALHTVYVSYQKDDALIAIDTDRCNGARPEGCATVDARELHTGANPESVALDPTTHTLYTANQVDNSISVLDASRCRAADTSGCRQRAPEVPLSGGAGAAADSAAGTIYIAGQSGVSLLDSRRCNAFVTAGCAAKPASALAGTRTGDVAVDALAHAVYVTTADGSIAVLDDRTCNATRQTNCTSLGRVPADASALAVNPLTHTLYAAGHGDISVLDTRTCRTGCSRPLATVRVSDDDVMDLAVNRLTDTLYATSINRRTFSGQTVFVIDGAVCNAANTSGCGDAPETIRVGRALFSDLNPIAIAVAEATNTVFTANLSDGEEAGSVSIIDGATCNGRETRGCSQTPAKVPAGFGTVAVAVDPLTATAYTANDEDTSVTTVNCRATKPCPGTQTRPIVGDYPRAITVDPVLRTGYVISLEGVSVIGL